MHYQLLRLAYNNGIIEYYDFKNHRLEAFYTVEPDCPPAWAARHLMPAEELEAFFVVKSICREIVESKRITYKDTLSYFTILLDNNTWRWICRLYLNGNKKYLSLPSGDKENRIPINNIDDIYSHKAEIIEAVKAYAN